MLRSTPHRAPRFAELDRPPFVAHAALSEAFLLGFAVGAATIVSVLIAIGHYLDVADPFAKADAILVETASATTEENATRVAELMTARNIRSAILVTSPYHQRRAAMLFAREFDRRGGLSFRNHPADDPRWDPNVWWTSEPSRTLMLVELAKLGALVAGQRPG